MQSKYFGEKVINYGTNVSFYSNINFMFEYIKEGILEQLFVDGKNTFGEIITNYARPELRDSELKDEREKRLILQKNHCSLNLTVDYNDSTFITNNNFDSTIGFGRRPSLGNIILRDNLFTLGFNNTPVKMNLDIAIISSDKLRLTNYAGYIKQRIHMGKFFRLNEDISLKFVLDKTLIDLMKLLYPEIPDIEFEERLSKLTNGNIFKELDKTTGNIRYFTNLITKPLLRINSLDDTDNLKISMEIFTYFPSTFTLHTLVTLEELTDLIITQEVVTTTDVPPEDLDKLLNFSPKYIVNNRDKFSFTDEEVGLILDGKLYPIVDLKLSTIKDTEVKIIGKEVDIEDIRFRLESQIGSTEFISKVKNTVSTDPDWFKVSTVILNGATNPNGVGHRKYLSNEIYIDDTLFTVSYYNNKSNIDFVIKLNNKIVEYTSIEYLEEHNALLFTLDKSLKSGLVSITMFKRT